jgi:ubiquinone/menaquinone biosynthesis C-methylase UbiE
VVKIAVLPSRWRSYHDVDAAGDPDRLSGQLDDIASIPAVAKEKQRSIELLELAPGDRVLDVGCGNGSELRALAETVGPGGRVVGLDRSTTLIAEAAARGLSAVEPIELITGDAHALPFPDQEFSACRADRALQHLARPEDAIAEMARVTRARGRVLVTESRWGLVAPDLDRGVTDRLLQVMATDTERESWLGDELPSMLERAGLVGVQSVTRDYVLDQLEPLSRFIGLRWSVQRAVRTGALAPAEARDWSEGLRDLVTRGDAFVMVLIVHYVALKPETGPSAPG